MVDGIGTIHSYSRSLSVTVDVGAEGVAVARQSVTSLYASCDAWLKTVRTTGTPSSNLSYNVAENGWRDGESDYQAQAGVVSVEWQLS